MTRLRMKEERVRRVHRRERRMKTLVKRAMTLL